MRMGLSASDDADHEESSPRPDSEDHLQLLDSVHALLGSIEDFRMSEISHETATVASLSGTAAVIHNAQHLVAIVELWQLQHLEDVDAQTIEELVETVFNALHRWLSWKSFVQLPKPRKSSSASSVKSRSCAEDTLETLLSGDPWEDCDELAAEDLLAWLADTMPYPAIAGTCNEHTSYETLPEKGVVCEGRTDLARFTEVSTCASSHSRNFSQAFRLSVSSDCSDESDLTALQDEVDSQGGLEDHPAGENRLLQIAPQDTVSGPAYAISGLTQPRQLLDVVSVDKELLQSELSATSLHVQRLHSSVAMEASCNCLSCLLNNGGCVVQACSADSDVALLCHPEMCLEAEL